jgi:hypothetical protein
MQWRTPALIWGIAAGGAVSLFMSDVPLFKKDVLMKVPVVSLNACPQESEYGRMRNGTGEERDGCCSGRMGDMEGRQSGSYNRVLC